MKNNRDNYESRKQNQGKPSRERREAREQKRYQG